MQQRPKRADARRSYEKALTAARQAFGERGAAASLEEIARRAEVGMGTLSRSFPDRRALLEAVYVEETTDVCRSAGELDDLPPWDAFAAWANRLAGYLAMEHALAQELSRYVDPDAPLFTTCREALSIAGRPVLDRAQRARAVRPDTDVPEIIQIVQGIARIPTADREQIQHILEIALDGLRFRSPDAAPAKVHGVLTRAAAR